MKRRMLICVVFLSVLGAADRDALKAPNGIAFSEVRGFESWQYVAPSLTNEHIKLIAANPAMIAAYKEGFPSNGKKAPDGAMFVKIEWAKKGSPEFPAQVTVPGALQALAFMVKDSKRFPETDGWGYAEFKYDAASGTFAPAGDASTGKKICHQCHQAAARKDFVFTAYPTR